MLPVLKRWIPMWVVPVLMALAAGTVWLRLWIIQTSYELDLVSKMHRNTRLQIERLELEVSQLGSPRNLEKLAQKKFRLHAPSGEQMIYLTEKK